MVGKHFNEFRTPSVLILDDDSKWLEKLKAYVEKAGFKYRATDLASEAIEIAVNDDSIKVALSVRYRRPICRCGSYQGCMFLLRSK